VRAPPRSVSATYYERRSRATCSTAVARPPFYSLTLEFARRAGSSGTPKKAKAELVESASGGVGWFGYIFGGGGCLAAGVGVGVAVAPMVAAALAKPKQ
jgi:hypothetical protein